MHVPDLRQPAFVGALIELASVERPHEPLHVAGQVNVDAAGQRADVGERRQRREPVVGQAPMRLVLETIQTAMAIIITFSVSETNPSGTLLDPRRRGISARACRYRRP